MHTVAIVDYGMCNLDSVARAVEECGGVAMVTGEATELGKADRIVLPGVGAFGDAMQNLRERSLDEALYDQVIRRRTPFLGICLGMQLLASKGWEGGEAEGLGWIEGEVKRLEPFAEDTRIPHIGWNEVAYNDDSCLFSKIPDRKDFYFVHSYHFCPKNSADILAETPYGRGFVSAVKLDSIFGVQFHPEKSQQAGFQVLRNFIGI